MNTVRRQQSTTRFHTTHVATSNNSVNAWQISGISARNAQDNVTSSKFVHAIFVAHEFDGEEDRANSWTLNEF
jgi:hypothetical protein